MAEPRRLSAPGGSRRRSTRRPARLLGALAIASAVVAAACTAPLQGHGSTTAAPRSTPAGRVPSATRPAPPVSSGAPTPTGCPVAGRAAPDPNRPRVALAFTVSANHTTVTGTERIAFRPDKPITELVFRLTANTKPTVAEGNKIVVTSAAADHGARKIRFTSANADPTTQGGLLHIPFGSTIPAGTVVNARLAFTLTLGSQSFDRFGRTGAYAYFASAHPLLSWERGYGWHTEGMIEFPAESATSEAAMTTLTVTAPARDVVIMSGNPATPPVRGETRTWRASETAARDVSVAVGPFRVGDTTVDGVRLHLGAPSEFTVQALLPEFVRAMRALAARFGPFPFPSLSVARLPAQGGGIEYPGSILMLDGSRLVAVHETAHQWFYAMVGDSQAQHPWLDEGFAEYAEQQVNHDAPNDNALNVPGPVDASTESYGTDVNRYYFTTYNKGAAALTAARQAAGPAAWDRALRCYVATNAWRIANPSDLQAAIKGLPAAVAILRRAGALK